MSQPPPPYVMLATQGTQNQRPPPPPSYHVNNNNIPMYQTEYYGKRSRGCCCRVICCCCCFLFLLILIFATGALYLYAFYRPQMPSYNLENINIKTLSILPAGSILDTEIEATMRAENPNSVVGFVYGGDSSAEVIYTDTTLCSGKLPHFRQGFKNVTIMKIDLKGRSHFGRELQEAFEEDNSIGKIPLLVKIRAPIKIEVENNHYFTMREISVSVNCSLVVDSLEPNKDVRILSSNYAFAFSLV